MTSDRRKYPRIDRIHVALFAIESSYQAKQWDEVVIHNLSEDGLCVAIKEALPENTNITIKMQFPLKPGKWYEYKGKILNSSEKIINFYQNKEGLYFTRIKFTELGSEELTLLRELINWQIALKKDREEKRLLKKTAENVYH